MMRSSEDAAWRADQLRAFAVIAIALLLVFADLMIGAPGLPQL